MKLTLLSLVGLAAFAMADDVELDADGLPKPKPGPGSPGPLVPGPGGPGGPLIPPVSKPFGDGPGKWTTSTVYSTTIKTITSCPPEKPACPATSTRVTTVIVPVSTTVCPVETTSTKKPHPIPHPPTDKPKPVHPLPPPETDKPKPVYPPPGPPTDKPKPTAPPVLPPPVTTGKSIGTTGLPPKPSVTKPAVVTAGAAHVQRAGGALAAIAVAAALF